MLKNWTYKATPEIHKEDKLSHISVLPSEVVSFINPRPHGLYIDATLGAGGHTAAIFEKEPLAKVIGLDCDPCAIEMANKNFKDANFDFRAVLTNFSKIEQIAAKFGKADGVVADLGLSSMQIDDDRRGFSFKSDGNLDMRMSGNTSNSISAGDIVNTFPEEELERIFRIYGDERFARHIARAIVKERVKRPFVSARSLGDFIVKSVGSRRRGNRRIHPATRVFQSLRIFVNNEIDNLSCFLDALPRIMKVGGRCVVISFHSGEDRVVKRAFASFVSVGIGQLLTKKPVVPTEEEIRRNPRSRSAKLRAIEFIFAAQVGA